MPTYITPAKLKAVAKKEQPSEEEISSEYDKPPMKTTETPAKVAPAKSAAKIKDSSSEEDLSSEDRTPPAKKTVSHRPSRHEPLRVTGLTLPLAAPGTSHTRQR